MIKAGAQRVAAELGLALVTCDTSPRAARFPGDDASWDFGLGAGVLRRRHRGALVDAPTAWRRTSRRSCRRWSRRTFRCASDARGIFGHSMGGHGALTLALRHPDRYRSVSAFAPIVAPTQVPWGIQAFGRLPRGGDAHDGPSTTPPSW